MAAGAPPRGIGVQGGGRHARRGIGVHGGRAGSGERLDIAQHWSCFRTAGSRSCEGDDVRGACVRGPSQDGSFRIRALTRKLHKHAHRSTTSQNSRRQETVVQCRQHQQRISKSQVHAAPPKSRSIQVSSSATCALVSASIGSRLEPSWATASRSLGSAWGRVGTRTELRDGVTDARRRGGRRGGLGRVLALRTTSAQRSVAERAAAASTAAATSVAASQSRSSPRAGERASCDPSSRGVADRPSSRQTLQAEASGVAWAARSGVAERAQAEHLRGGGVFVRGRTGVEEERGGVPGGCEGSIS